MDITQYHELYHSFLSVYDPDERPQAEMCWSRIKVVLGSSSVAGSDSGDSCRLIWLSFESS